MPGESQTAAAEIEAMAAIADKLARSMGRRFVLDRAKVAAYVAHNQERGA